MPWSVEPPTLGSSYDEEPDNDSGDEAGARVDIEVELPREVWGPIEPDGDPAETVVFVDGVQRLDGKLRHDDGTEITQGWFVSLAAGMVYCDGAARIDTASIQMQRMVLALPAMRDIDCGNGIVWECAPTTDVSDMALMSEMHNRRERLEMKVTESLRPVELVVIDGHLRHREAIENAVGYIKTQRQQYLPPEQHALIRRLQPGQRTPVFLIEKDEKNRNAWERYSWYARLPHKFGLPLPGIVRYEAAASLTGEQAVRLAKLTSVTVPRYASEPHKDPRAPQNLYPIGGLERALRRRLGDQMLLMRSLMRAQARQNLVSAG